MEKERDQVKRTDQPAGQYKINPNPNTNTKYVLIYYAINAGPFFSLDTRREEERGGARTGADQIEWEG